ncbi:MAG: hypothetical protein K0R59_1980 [Sphingobacterium sp.]|jgi:hypothetical protein|uniref:outer membrane beta-barrel protein n=1 Tax=Sphingobacterium sp. CZ-UAM TaxID=1933868 RepID=UPI000987C5FF|nr:outer membrane beta-barrel protein [Sphingobacterium sp. CZ-UAM]MDF2516684.1 hypothetical protein [Sphingobacterium sp.]OOG16864.1 hypothetical protein BWD42_18795 [Sphingobacterium sp. CZ-UAM]
MITIKKLSLLLCLSVGSFLVHAQTKWNVKAGLNFSNVDAKNKDGNKANTESVGGLYLGIGPTIRMSERFAIEPAFVFARRGFERKEGKFIGWGENFKANTSYLELPIDVVFNSTVGNDQLQFGLGPYIAYGLGGKWKTSEEVYMDDIGIGNKGDIKFQNDASIADYGDYILGKTFDYGARAKVNYLFRGHYLFGMEFQKGIANLESKWGDYKTGRSLRNHSFGISLGYKF